MKKVIFLLFFVSITGYSQWEIIGNADRLRTYKSKIVDFVITQDCKFIYTLDTSSVIIKWDYVTGDSISSIKYQPDNIQNRLYQGLFLSTDAKTFCTAYCVFQDGGMIRVFYITYIYDLNSGIMKDSLNKLTDFTLDSYCQQIPSSSYIDYLSNQKILFNSLNYTYTCHLTEETYERSGTIYIYSKSDTGWVLKKQFDGNRSNVVNNRTNEIKYIYLDYSFNYSFTHVNPVSIIKNFNSNYYYNLTTDSLKTISNYEYYNESHKDGGTTSYTKGKSYTFYSVFFENINKNIYLSIYNNIYKFNLDSNDFIQIQTLDRYPSGKNLKTYNTTDNSYFFVVTDNKLNVHSLIDFKYFNSFVVDSIDIINLMKNSPDDKFIFLTDSNGKLYRINYQTLYESTSIENLNNLKIENTEIKMSPNPATDFIEISCFNHTLKGVVDWVSPGIKIYNSLGEVVLRNPYSALPTSEGVKIDVSGLLPGLYFVRVGDKVSKFVKI